MAQSAEHATLDLGAMLGIEITLKNCPNLIKKTKESA